METNFAKYSRAVPRRLADVTWWTVRIKLGLIDKVMPIQKRWTLSIIRFIPKWLFARTACHTASKCVCPLCNCLISLPLAAFRKQGGATLSQWVAAPVRVREQLYTLQEAHGGTGRLSVAQPGILFGGGFNKFSRGQKTERTGIWGW